jgi:hypothetical protein
MEAPPVKRGWRVMAPAHAGGREDRLSDLPEGVLHRVMSFLDSRQAVRTCVLSRRWRDVWRTVPRVHADFCDFTLNWTSDDDEVDEAAVAEDEVVFNRFVNRLLELRDPNASIRSFFLRFCRSDGGDDGSAEGNRWISYALQKNVRVLEVAVLSHALELDHSVFSSRYLRTMDFSNVVMNQGFFKQLEMGCPELEELFLDECFIVDDEISSQTLKVLTLDATHFCCGFKTSISSPSITSLALHYPMSGKPVLNDMEALMSTSMLLCCVESGDFDAYDLRHYLWSFSHVKDLDFSYQGRKVCLLILHIFPCLMCPNCGINVKRCVDRVDDIINHTIQSNLVHLFMYSHSISGSGTGTPNVCRGTLAVCSEPEGGLGFVRLGRGAPGSPAAERDSASWLFAPPTATAAVD